MPKTPRGYITLLILISIVNFLKPAGIQAAPAPAALDNRARPPRRQPFQAVQVNLPQNIILINNGAEFTAEHQVSLILNPQPLQRLGPINQMRFSNDNANWSNLEAYRNRKQWVLSAGPGQKAVFVQFHYRDAGWSQSYSDSITVINPPPEILSLTPQNNTKFKAGDEITITVQAQDPEGDNLEYRYLVDGGVLQDWTAQASYSWRTQAQDVRLKTISVQVRDEYGATSSRETRVFLFRSVPQPAR